MKDNLLLSLSYYDYLILNCSVDVSVQNVSSLVYFLQTNKNENGIEI